MEHSVGKLLPADGFRLSKYGEIPLRASVSLSHLYQPLIGQLPISLYQLLLSEYDTLELDQVQSHHTLMTYLSLPLDKIYDARKKLEAIGLLRTFKLNDHDNQTEYVYQLYPPFSPEEFFHDDMLSLLLHHHLGADKYTQLKHRFVRNGISLHHYEEVTATYDEVFHHMPATAIPPDKTAEDHVPSGRKDRGPLVEENRIDFDWIHHALKQRMYPSDRILTGQNKRLIAQLASLYNLSTHEIEKSVTWAINEENELIVEELKAACHDFMKDKPSSQSDRPIERRDKVASASAEQPQSKEDQFIGMLEQISPKELLEDLSGGHQASGQDLKLIRDVMTEQGISPGVMNVLVHYVLLKTDMKLSKPYLEKIASHWMRKNVKNVRQAMNLAKAEHQKYQQWGKQNSQYRKNKSQEVIPAWFNKDEASAGQEDHSTEVNSDEIAERIKKLTNKGH